MNCSVSISSVGLGLFNRYLSSQYIVSIQVETMAELNIARRCRGVAISSITCLEKHVLELEGKEKLSHKDEEAIKG